MTCTRREAIGLMSATIGAAALRGSAGVPPTRQPAGRLKQSVSRWPYARIPLNDFCRAAAGMGLVAIDLLQPDDWERVKEFGLICSMGYPADRRDFIATGFNDPAHHAMLLNELQKKDAELNELRARLEVLEKLVKELKETMSK